VPASALSDTIDAGSLLFGREVSGEGSGGCADPEDGSGGLQL
jgi:hypothetical protein